MNHIVVSLFSVVTWLLALGIFSFTKSLPRVGFVITHYIIDAALFGLAFYLYFKFLGKLSPFNAMATAMLTLFVLEFFLWKFFFPSQTNYLTFVDWIVPAFIIASVIYLVGVNIGKM